MSKTKKPKPFWEMTTAEKKKRWSRGALIARGLRALLAQEAE
jgi:hypothetical protein